MALPFGLDDALAGKFGARLEEATQTMMKLDGSVKDLDRDVKALQDSMRALGRALEDYSREIRTRS